MGAPEVKFATGRVGRSRSSGSHHHLSKAKARARKWKSAIQSGAARGGGGGGHEPATCLSSGEHLFCADPTMRQIASRFQVELAALLAKSRLDCGPNVTTTVTHLALLSAHLLTAPRPFRAPLSRAACCGARRADHRHELAMYFTGLVAAAAFWPPSSCMTAPARRAPPAAVRAGASWCRSSWPPLSRPISVC